MHVDRLTSALAAAALFCALPATSFAYSSGIDSSSFTTASLGCNNCHSGGTAPTVTVTPAALTVGTGQTINVTVTLTTPNGTEGGFNLRTGGVGTFTAPTGSGAKVLSGEATHSARKAENSTTSLVEFTVSWQAPTTTQTVTFTGWGNSVNGNGFNSGDRGGTASATVQVCTPYYQDADLDGYGSKTVMTASCTGAPTGYIATGGDCDDTNNAVNPGATEVCNGLDDDCKNGIDDGVKIAFYQDADGDKYGRPTGAQLACTAPAGWVADNTDCQDLDATVYPGAPELCNKKSEDCDLDIDEDLPLVEHYPDVDKDGFGDESAPQMKCELVAGVPPYTGLIRTGGDCNDADANVNPGAAEICNGVSDNCDSTVDEGLTQSTWFADGDGDGFGGAPQLKCDRVGGWAGFTKISGDCDDGDGSIHPDAAETCDGVDEDCDNAVDDEAPLASCGVGVCAAFGTGCAQSTCTPGAPGTESCNTLDDDCDGTADENPDELCDGDLTCQQGQCMVKAVTDGGTGGQPAEEVGCGCSGSGSGALASLLLAFAALAVRRRRRS